MNAQPNYQRMPGPGDLPGDNTHPNSPSYVEPAYPEWKAMRNVADDMDADERAVVLGDLADANGWLATVLANYEIPMGARRTFETLIRHGSALEAKRDAEYRVLNGADR